MATNNVKKSDVKENIEAKLARYFGCTPADASRDQMYKAVAMTIKDILTQKQGGFCDLITKLFTCCEKCETRNLESKADHI